MFNESGGRINEAIPSDYNEILFLVYRHNPYCLYIYKAAVEIGFNHFDGYLLIVEMKFY
jgi:hypothetical protein